MDNHNRPVDPSSAEQSIEALRRRIGQQQLALQTKGQLIDNMAYQIRTLSNAIIGFSDLLLSESLPPDHREYAEEINQAGKDLSDLVNEVLDWARLEAGRLRLTRTPCAISEILSRLDQTLRPAATNKGIGFEIRLDPALPETIITDADRLLKCLVTLSANILQQAGNGSIQVTVQADTRHDSAWIRIDLTNRTHVIDPQHLATLFDPPSDQEQVHAEMLTMMNSGLSVTAGLPLTRQLVQVLGGLIDIQSDNEKGTTFSLSLPVDTTPPRPEHTTQPITNALRCDQTP
jgi:hypothetical protein